MNSQTTASVATYSSKENPRQLTLIFAVVFILTLVSESVFGWEIDLSRRRKETQKKEGQSATVDQPKAEDLFLDLFNPNEARQEMVILNTDKGFIPSKVSLRKGIKYVIHVVNVNEREKNVSFILDSFSEHHSTFYGKIKTFEIKPAAEGIFTFQCPETSFEGKFVVVAPQETATRGVASEKEKASESQGK